MTVKRVDRKEQGKWTKFCPRCGKTTDELFDSVCKECFTAGIKLIGSERLNLTLSVCKNCGGYFKGKERTSIKDAVVDSVSKEIRRRYGYGCTVEEKELEEEITAKENKASAVLCVRTEIKGVDIEETGKIEVNFKSGICERCNRIASGYYAGIVQIRADDRLPTDDEIAMAEKIVYSALGESDFITKEIAMKEGLDLYVSSMECGRRISRGVVERLGGSFSESSKLYGRKDGRDIYRVTFSVRLPGFKVGTVLEMGDKVISVERLIKGKGVECVDVNTHERVFLRKKETKKVKFR